jgi:hypothetical protein
MFSDMRGLTQFSVERAQSKIERYGWTGEKRNTLRASNLRMFHDMACWTLAQNRRLDVLRWFAAYWGLDVAAVEPRPLHFNEPDGEKLTIVLHAVRGPARFRGIWGDESAKGLLEYERQLAYSLVTPVVDDARRFPGVWTVMAGGGLWLCGKLVKRKLERWNSTDCVPLVDWLVQEWLLHPPTLVQLVRLEEWELLKRAARTGKICLETEVGVLTEAWSYFKALPCAVDHKLPSSMSLRRALLFVMQLLGSRAAFSGLRSKRAESRLFRLSTGM